MTVQTRSNVVGARAPSLVVEGVSKGFGERRAVRDVSFDVAPVH